MGVAAAFGRRFEGGFVAGLPETCFDLALLRRIPDGIARLENTRSGDGHGARPSWSWAGWDTAENVAGGHHKGLMMGYEARSLGYIVAKRQPSVEIIPIDVFYTCVSKKGKSSPLLSPERNPPPYLALVVKKNRTRTPFYRRPSF